MKTVQVLLSTYNGEKYLQEQIDSLINQKGVHVHILVRDDGSTDKTKELLENWSNKGILTWYDGENLRPAKSFMDLVSNISVADYYAFSDQDDVWERDKLEVAINALEKYPSNKPAMYFSDYSLVDENLDIMYTGKRRPVQVTLASQIVGNTATGCTIVANAELLKLASLYFTDCGIFHDYWFCLVCLAVGGNVYYDKTSHIKYRQHGTNADGGIYDFRKVMSNRIKLLITKKGLYRQFIARDLLNKYGDLIPENNKEILELVGTYKESWQNRLSLLGDKRFLTGILKRDLLFYFAVLFGAF